MAAILFAKKKSVATLSLMLENTAMMEILRVGMAAVQSVSLNLVEMELKTLGKSAMIQIHKAEMVVMNSAGCKNAPTAELIREKNVMT